MAAELEKWLAYLNGVEAAAVVLGELGVEESSELKLLDQEDVEKIADVLPKVNLSDLCDDVQSQSAHCSACVCR